MATIHLESVTFETDVITQVILVNQNMILSFKCTFQAITLHILECVMLYSFNRETKGRGQGEGGRGQGKGGRGQGEGGRGQGEGGRGQGEGGRGQGEGGRGQGEGGRGQGEGGRGQGEGGRGQGEGGRGQWLERGGVTAEGVSWPY